MEDSTMLSYFTSEPDDRATTPFSCLKNNQVTGLPSTNQTQPAAEKGISNIPLTNGEPDTEVVALSPCTLAATTLLKYTCDICSKEFKRNQNLQLHRRVHKLKPINSSQEEEVKKKKVYVCPAASCVHHHHSKAFRDLTGIRKHFCRKHGERKWKCEKCFKSYGMEYDWKIHSKICVTTDYRCDCGTFFSRRETFVSHRAFCRVSTAEEKQTPQVISSLGTGSNINELSDQIRHFDDRMIPFEPERDQDLIAVISPWIISPSGESGAGGPAGPTNPNVYMWP